MFRHNKDSGSAGGNRYHPRKAPRSAAAGYESGTRSWPNNSRLNVPPSRWLLGEASRAARGHQMRRELCVATGDRSTHDSATVDVGFLPPRKLPRNVFCATRGLVSCWSKACEPSSRTFPAPTWAIMDSASILSSGSQPPGATFSSVLRTTNDGPETI